MGRRLCTRVHYHNEDVGNGVPNFTSTNTSIFEFLPGNKVTIEEKPSNDHPEATVGPQSMDVQITNAYYNFMPTAGVKPGQVFRYAINRHTGIVEGNNSGHNFSAKWTGMCHPVTIPAAKL
jgi:hypothetical protein